MDDETTRLCKTIYHNFSPGFQANFLGRIFFVATLPEETTHVLPVVWEHEPYEVSFHTDGYETKAELVLPEHMGSIRINPIITTYRFQILSWNDLIREQEPDDYIKETEILLTDLLREGQPDYTQKKMNQLISNHFNCDTYGMEFF